MPSAIQTREAGMDLVHRVNRWLVAGAVSAAGFLYLIAAHGFHGHSVAVGGSTSSASRGVQQSQGPSSAGAGLGSPAQAPAPATPAPGAVVSGGS
jgi:tryptophan synthase alpha subunit